MNQLTILIFTDDPEFAHTLTARWQTERTVPNFLISNESRWEEDRKVTYDLAIVGPLASENPVEAIKLIELNSRPGVYVSSRSVQTQGVRSAHPRVLVLNDHEGWVNAAVLLAGEALRRVDATQRAKKAEQNVSSAQKHAVLGRYMLDMRHSLNNALTSIMGNSELLLLEPGKLSADVREQVETIHSMSMRVHEILQRFTSLETEMQFAEKVSHREMNVPMHSYVNGD
ncbi:MAG TPA: histidine kinase dimerization/phospho-acceptor domain-containing protein [Terriglobales bacterium]|nr:histidine kinase dimerization/phospho-acceptor domain-containing protein [Terriglobales bacterium]